MGVSKSLRFQVFRRDGNVCQYCGGRPPDVALVVDHVVPVALGGCDGPENLTTSCRDCNAGKSATPADAPVVAAVSERQRAFRAEMERLAVVDKDDREGRDLDWFTDLWDEHEWSGGWNRPTGSADLPSNWQGSVRTWQKRGLTRDDIGFAIDRAQNKEGMSPDAVFRYMAGICWRILTEREQAAAEAVGDERDE